MAEAPAAIKLGATPPAALLNLSGATEASGQSRPSARGTPLAINLGIDFGTCFTKVAYRDQGLEQTGIVTFDATNAELAMVPSVVTVDRGGSLALGEPDPASASENVALRYLKMRLADAARPNLPNSIQEPLPTVNGIDLNSNLALRGLTSWFLASVILKARPWLLAHGEEWMKGRSVSWSANVGVPVEYCDSPALAVFNEVLAVAWSWAQSAQLPTMIEEIQAHYQHTLAEAHAAPSDCHAVPEISAAIHSFIMSRQAEPGVYVYFDVGGGTVDGVGFNFLNDAGVRRVNFYSGRVEPLGIAAVTERYPVRQRSEIEFMLHSAENLISPELQPVEPRLRTMVGTIINVAHIKDGRNWQRARLQRIFPQRNRFGTLAPGQMEPLPIFVGGGGAKSAWYRRVIQSTYVENQHDNAGIPPYELAEVPPPADLNMNGIARTDFSRFAIAYGLSVPKGEGPEFSLPSEIEERPPLPRAIDPFEVQYENSKEVMQ